MHRVNAFGRFDAETYAAVAEAEADEDGDSLDAAAVASSRRGSRVVIVVCRWLSVFGLGQARNGSS